MSTHLVRKPESLTHALADHARALEPIVGVLALGILLELVPLGWTVRKSKSGALSVSIRKGSHQYHFRAERPYTEILVKDAWKNGAVVATIATRTDALRFIRELVAHG